MAFFTPGMDRLYSGRHEQHTVDVDQRLPPLRGGTPPVIGIHARSCCCTRCPAQNNKERAMRFGKKTITASGL